MKLGFAVLLLIAYFSHSSGFYHPLLPTITSRPVYRPQASSQRWGEGPGNRNDDSPTELKASMLSSQPRNPEVKQESSNHWHWKNGWYIHYEQKGENGPPLLLVPGFGVGVFHYRRNIEELSKDHRVYALDLLGQGRSWPTERRAEDELCYSIDTWREQIATFIQEVIGEPVYIAGNSLGGLLAVSVSAYYKHLTKGVILMNATPFWAFLPHREKMPEWASSIIPWDGTLPAPDPLYKLGAFYFDQLRNPQTIGSMLKAVYANQNAFDDTLIEEIMEPTRSGHGHEAFTSILFAPKPYHSFEELLDMVEAPMVLMYGKEDPWVTPVWGQKLKKKRPDALYYELSPCGHCPAHEAPQAVNTLMREWVKVVEDTRKAGKHPTALEEALARQAEEMRIFREKITGAEVKAQLVDGSPRNTLEWLAQNWLLADE